VLPVHRGGVAEFDPVGPGFAPPTEPKIGNDLPAWTGSHTGPVDRPGPGPSAGGQTGDYDGYSGADPSRPKVSPDPSSPRVGAWGEGDPGYDQAHQSFRRYGIQGFNDRLQVRDRHAYYDRGMQRTGLAPSVPGTQPNNHTAGPARPDLRAVNISVNPQIGSDASRNQDDLSRPYTWLGQQDGTTSPVYGGVPGLYVPYGTRGGYPYPVCSPVGEGEPGDGPAMVWSGPPHGLHSDTISSGKQIVERYGATPQMRPVRLDRPANATAAGQSFSQTVPMQGQQPVRAAQARQQPGTGLSFHVGGRGWLGGR
jgi:hypothetical protein